MSSPHRTGISWRNFLAGNEVVIEGAALGGNMWKGGGEILSVTGHNPFF